MASPLRYLPYLGFVSAAVGSGYLVSSRTVLARDDGDGPNGQLVEPLPSRAQQLSKLRGSAPHRPFDLLIIGGGATGAGCAVDAATRGLRTALVEREDFGSGTSSKSTKLVHGGVRYLEKAVWKLDYGQLKLVNEALRERRALLDNAPHLAGPLPILTPCYAWWEVPYYWAGLKAYDLVAGSRNLTMSRYVQPQEALRQMPTLAAASAEGRSLKGAIQYFDGQFDDARLNVALACTAAAAGAAVANHLECVGLVKNEEGQVIGARVRDRLGPGGGEETFEIYAKVVINATGPYADAIRRQSQPDAPQVIMPSAGTHVALPPYFASDSVGLIVPKTKDGRVVFVLPWQGHIIAGTTDEKCDVTDRPAPTEREIAFILDVLREHLSVQVGRADVLSAWSGIRPLAVDPKAVDTANALRDHVIIRQEDGVITVTGGKWTTYRMMAEEAVDAAVASGRLPSNVRPCATERLRLLGAQRYHPRLLPDLAQLHDAQQRAAATAAAAASPAASTSGRSSSNSRSRSGNAAANTAAAASAAAIDLPMLKHLTSAYGDKAPALLHQAQEWGLARRLVARHPYMEAEVVHSVQHEYCQTVEDFIARRTRLAFLDVAAAAAAVPRVAELMAAELRWSAERRALEEAAALSHLRTCFAGGCQPHDSSSVVPQLAPSDSAAVAAS